ncbi:MAG: hypothetical protein C4521_01915 [Actinobacteria bacterium]|nr:MAG: hypothetical protein C4521_01915 [Actinomycetota bacterium]
MVAVAEREDVKQGVPAQAVMYVGFSGEESRERLAGVSLDLTTALNLVRVKAQKDGYPIEKNADGLVEWAKSDEDGREVFTAVEDDAAFVVAVPITPKVNDIGALMTILPAAEPAPAPAPAITSVYVVVRTEKTSGITRKDVVGVRATLEAAKQLAENHLKTYDYVRDQITWSKMFCSGIPYVSLNDGKLEYEVQTHRL